MLYTDVIVFYKFYDDDGRLTIKSMQTSFNDCIEELKMNPLGQFTKVNLRTMNDLMQMLTYNAIQK